MPSRVGLINQMKYDPETGCWNWTGTLSNGGYGKGCLYGKTESVHRIAAHLWLRFDLKSKLCVLHRCDNRRCFNPKHLFIGTQLENISDAIQKGRWVPKQKKTHCLRGHAFTPENTCIARGVQVCIACRRTARMTRYYEKERPSDTRPYKRKALRVQERPS